MLSRPMMFATICLRSDGTVKTHTSPVLSRQIRSSSTYDSSRCLQKTQTGWYQSVN